MTWLDSGTQRPICHACQGETPPWSHYCVRCRESILAAFVRRDHVQIPAGAEDRPVRRMEVNKR